MSVDWAKLSVDVVNGFDQAATSGNTELVLRKYGGSSYNADAQTQSETYTDYAVSKYVRHASRVNFASGASGAGVRVQEFEVLVAAADMITAGWPSNGTLPDETCALVFDPNADDDGPIMFRVVNTERQVGETMWRIVVRRG